MRANSKQKYLNVVAARKENTSLPLAAILAKNGIKPAAYYYWKDKESTLGKGKKEGQVITRLTTRKYTKKRPVMLTIEAPESTPKMVFAFAGDPQQVSEALKHFLQ